VKPTVFAAGGKRLAAESKTEKQIRPVSAVQTKSQSLAPRLFLRPRGAAFGASVEVQRNALLT